LLSKERRQPSGVPERNASPAHIGRNGRHAATSRAATKDGPMARSDWIETGSAL